MVPERGATVLITGAGGFAGRHLVPVLRARGFRVAGTGHRPGDGIEALDVTDARAVDACVARCRPAAVVHLAAVGYLPDVERDPAGSFAVNVLGTQKLLRAVARSAPAARVLVVSSCTVYGAPAPGDLPLREDAPLRAVHPYGVQKIGLELVARESARDDGLDVVVARPFNHIGPGQDRRISLTHFATQIADAERGRSPPVLRTGNLAARRDLLDVGDVVRAYALLLEHPDPPRTVNVASGRSLGIGEALDILLGLSTLRFTIENDPSRMRKLDVADLYGSSELLRRATGWVPEIPLESTLARILESVRGAPSGAAT